MEFQLITPESNCPFSAEIYTLNNKSTHFHKNLELLFLLNGSMLYEIDNNKYSLCEKDFIFANPFEHHSIVQTSDDCRIFSLEIDMLHFLPFFQNLKDTYYIWDETINNRNHFLYKNITKNFRNIILNATNQEQDFLAKSYHSVLDIMLLLNNHCRGKKKKANNVSQNILKAKEIIQYLDMHYMEPISLNDVAKKMCLSAPYTSKIFSNIIGTGFLDYLNRLRVQKSLMLLNSTDDYILDIALSVGFNNLKTYGRAFQKEYGISPKEYRQSKRKEDSSLATASPKELMPSVMDFLYDNDYSIENPCSPKRSITIEQDFINPDTKITENKWNKILSVGVASLLLHRKVQKEILEAVHEIRFEYVRIVGILSDTLQIYQEDLLGNSFYYWVNVDEVLDFLYHNKLKPYICLGFMPNKLAANKWDSPYKWDANISKPKSMEKWSEYLKSFLVHCCSRYSYEEVQTWKFEFWNSFDYFWRDSMNDFLEFFLASYKTFRSVLPTGCFGAPAFVDQSNKVFTEKFITLCKNNNVKLDFFTLHLFMDSCPNNSNPQNIDISDNDGSCKPEKHSYVYNFINNSVNNFYNLICAHNYKAPIIISEWNLNPAFKDYIRDTCFMSAYIANTINCLPDSVEAISFWALTDSLGEHSPDQVLFSGELGLKTYNSLPKPSYLAFTLLNKMKKQLVSSGNGYRITMSSNSIQILLYNYVFFNTDFLSGTSYKLSYHDRYQIFEHQDDLLFRLHLTLSPGTYRIERYALNREHGSIYDSWLRMGAPDIIDSSISKYLSFQAFPELKIHNQYIEKHLLLSESVPTHGILLIKLTNLSKL